MLWSCAVPARFVSNAMFRQHFSLDDTLLEHLPRNALLIEWLKLIHDPKGGPYVRALQEGTRRMRDEMHALGLPAPE